jgi:predicted  nucleic acid-binding Zn-ribbon protein
MPDVGDQLLGGLLDSMYKKKINPNLYGRNDKGQFIDANGKVTTAYIQPNFIQRVISPTAREAYNFNQDAGVDAINDAYKAEQEINRQVKLQGMLKGQNYELENKFRNAENDNSYANVVKGNAEWNTNNLNQGLSGPPLIPTPSRTEWDATGNPSTLQDYAKVLEDKTAILQGEPILKGKSRAYSSAIENNMNKRLFDKNAGEIFADKKLGESLSSIADTDQNILLKPEETRTQQAILGKRLEEATRGEDEVTATARKLKEFSDIVKARHGEDYLKRVKINVDGTYTIEPTEFELAQARVNGTKLSPKRFEVISGNPITVLGLKPKK